MRLGTVKRLPLKEWHSFFIAVLAGAIALALFALADAPEIARRQAAERLEVLSKASTIRARLEGELNEHLRVTEAIAGLISVRGMLEDDEFQAVAKSLHSHARSMRNLGVAEGTTVRQVYPKAGNEAIIGVNYEALPMQWPLVERAIRERSSVLAGPVRLVQGGNGLIERTPIFRQSDQKFIGLVSLVLSSDSLFAASGMLEDPDLDIALARSANIAAFPSGLEVFYGRPSLVEQDPLQLGVRMLGAEWILLAAPRGGWTSGANFHPIRVVLQVVMALLVAIGVYALLSYVRRLREALSQVAEKEERLRLAQSIARMGDLKWAHNGRDMLWSEQVYHILGYPVGAGLARSEELWRVIFPEDQPLLSESLQMVRTTHEPVVIKVRLLTGDKSAHWGSFTLRWVPDANGGHLFATLTDITDQQREDEDRRRMVTRLRRSHDELEQFTWIASHHLQEPLRMISSYLQLLERRYSSLLDDDARAFVQFASKGALRMQNLILDLLAYTRITAEQPAKTCVRTRELADQICTKLDAEIKAAEAEISWGELPEVLGWREHLYSLFHELVCNALQYRSAHRTPQISIGAMRSGGMWEFRVVDNGQGIDPVFHAQIFKIFRRLSTSEESQGTGIGLALCQRVVEQHGGSMTVESQVDQGATFIFTLPAYDGAALNQPGQEPEPAPKSLT